MKVKGFILSDKNEGTEAPYWVIINNWSQLLSEKDYDRTASFITGVFFSRESAEEYLQAHRYNFSEHAVIYCMSGYGTDWGKLVKESSQGNSKVEVGDEKAQ